MFILLLGFIAPALLFAILGVIACLRRASYTVVDDDKSDSLSVSECSQHRRLLHKKTSLSHTNPFYLESGDCGYQMYQNRHFVEADIPPSYSEATGIGRISPSTKIKPTNLHLPPNQPRILVPHSTTALTTSSCSQ